MSMILTVIISILVSGLIFGLLGYFIRIFTVSGELRRTKDAVEGQIRRAESRSREILVEAKENALQIKSSAQGEINNSRRDLQRLETQLETREENLRKQNAEIKRKTENVEKKDNSLNLEREKIQKIESEQQIELEKISNYSADQAREVLIDNTNKNNREKEGK